MNRIERINAAITEIRDAENVAKGLADSGNREAILDYLQRALRALGVQP